MQAQLQTIKHWIAFSVIAIVSFVLTYFAHSYIFHDSVSVAQSADLTPFVDIRSVNPRIKLDVRYATPNNFVKRKLYREARCILRVPVAQALSQVQTELETRGLGLSVYDCYRPLSVQKAMWQIVPDSRFVANPATGSRHNRGAAVDLTLVDQRTGTPLTMPTEFDDFSDRASRTYADLPAQIQQNRQTLEDAMVKGGFVGLGSEWWHFDYKDWRQYPVRDLSFDAVAPPR